MSFSTISEQNNTSKHLWRILYGFGEFQAIIVMSIPFLQVSTRSAINGIAGMDIIGLESVEGFAIGIRTHYSCNRILYSNKQSF